MNSENSGRTWIILGTVITVIGGGSILIALALLYFFTLGPAAPERPTPTAPSVAVATEEPTQIIIRTRPPTQETTINDTPTPLPLPSGGGNNSSVPTAIVGSSFIESPEQSVVNYYRDITARNYDSSWAQLTDDFKREFNCCAPDYDFDGYLDWWNTVERVDFGDVRVIERNGNRAVVYAELIYTMNNGGSFEDEDPYIELTYSTDQGRWQFEDKRDTP